MSLKPIWKFGWIPV